MKVTVTFFGPLGEQAGQERVQFDLPQGSTYGDLLDDIGRRFGDRFHERIWDSKENLFKPGILTVGTGRDLRFRYTTLKEDEEIKVVPLVAGG
jgi:molybdopterin converting factor small subunit